MNGLLPIWKGCTRPQRLPYALLRILCIVLLREDPTAQVENWQRARQTNSLAHRDERQVPSTNNAQHPEPPSNLQKVRNVLEIGRGGRRRDREVRGGDEGEEEDEAEEDEREEDVDSEGAHEQDEGDQAPGDVSRRSPLTTKREPTYIVTLWKAWLELYGAPFAPPSPFSNGAVVWWIGSCVYAREPQCVP